MEKKWFYYGLYRPHGGTHNNTSTFFGTDEEITTQLKKYPPDPSEVNLNWNVCSIFLYELPSDGSEKISRREDILKNIFPEKYI